MTADMAFLMVNTCRRSTSKVLLHTGRGISSPSPSIRTKNLSSNKSEGNVIFETVGDRGLITLNKPKKLNSIDFDMVKNIKKKLKEWEKNKSMVVIRGKGRAFCAGADVVSLTKKGPKYGKLVKEFFKTEYEMNGFIGKYKIPYIAIMDGITMGGGVGLSTHGKVRIATEKTLFAMPETAIGLFPDVGTSYVLSRLPSHIGLFLALTGHRLQGVDVKTLGIATHYIDSKDVNNLFQELLKLKNPKTDLDNFLLKKCKDVSKEHFSMASHLKTIDKCFSAPTVEEIFERLDKNGSEFAIKALENLKKMSPISLKVTKRLIDNANTKNLQECLIIENRLAAAAAEAKVSADFYEGVRARLIDKDNVPKWNPPLLNKVTNEMVEKAFAKLKPEEELKF